MSLVHSREITAEQVELILGRGFPVQRFVSMCNAILWALSRPAGLTQVSLTERVFVADSGIDAELLIEIPAYERPPGALLIQRRLEVSWGRSSEEETRTMPKKAHTEEQIVAVLRQVEAGARVDDVCRKVGISQATYYLWKRKYTGVGVSELRELRQLREEVGGLKRLVADLSLDRQILQEIVSKKL